MDIPLQRCFARFWIFFAVVNTKRQISMWEILHENRFRMLWNADCLQRSSFIIFKCILIPPSKPVLLSFLRFYVLFGSRKRGFRMWFIRFGYGRQISIGFVQKKLYCSRILILKRCFKRHSLSQRNKSTIFGTMKKQSLSSRQMVGTVIKTLKIVSIGSEAVKRFVKLQR